MSDYHSKSEQRRHRILQGPMCYVKGIECPQCLQRIWSRYRHDCRSCFCGYCFVDGGRSYTRVGWGGPEWPEPWTPPLTLKLLVPRKEVYPERENRWPY